MEFLNESQEIIDINTTYKNLLNETDLTQLVKNIDSSKNLADFVASDSNSLVNKLMRPRGVIITDTFNHVIYPIAYPEIDTSKFDLPHIQKYFQELTGTKLDFLPWHFTVDFIKNRYYIFNTRPIDMKFPLSTQQWDDKIKKDNLKVNSRTHEFFINKPFDIEDAIHVAIIGNSSKDIYIKKMYELIGRNCIGPILRYFKLPGKMWQKTYALNMGKKFSTTSLDAYLTR